MAEDDGGGGLRDYKLCGFLQAVLSAPSPETLAPGVPCSLFADGTLAGFRSEDGTLLIPLQDPNASEEKDDRKRRRRGVPLVNGSGSVVHQLHELVAHKCLKIRARVVRVVARDGEGTRAVVLVDMYLPIEVWSGWQFPRSGALAASVFNHVSCNWEVRSSLLSFGQSSGGYHADYDCIWRCSYCHVIGCKMHYSKSGFGDKKSFDLHEIFKTLPPLGKEPKLFSTRIMPMDTFVGLGIWNVTDDVLSSILSLLGPKDLVRVAATCHHLRLLAVSIMPCMKLKLFPHQEAAVEWMLRRERNAEVLEHPLFKAFSTDDGFSFYINVVSGEICSGPAPFVNDFRGGLFCDDPGLGKTVTAISLILKTHGTLAEPPPGVDVVWCVHSPEGRFGYYEVCADDRFVGQNVRRGKTYLRKPSPSFSLVENSNPSLSKRHRSADSELSIESSSHVKLQALSGTDPLALLGKHALRPPRGLGHIKRNLLATFENDDESNDMEICSSTKQLKNSKKFRKANGGCVDSSETWVQCDACGKWRKLPQRIMLDATAAWFCIMNNDPLYQCCAAPEEPWDSKVRITYLPGFYSKGSPQGKEQNICFLTNVLKEHFMFFDSETKRALNWLANLSQDKLQEMETVGLIRIGRTVLMDSSKEAQGYHKIFQAFGLVRKVQRGICRWYYPSKLDNLAFDTVALKVALSKPLDLYRFYLSRATLVVVPANLVDHWKTQIEKHVSPGQLRIFLWTDHIKPCAHNLAWDYDVVITTFNRLSAEWGPHKRSVLMQIHWLRVMLDEGHTLGSSLSLTNKLQMAVSLAATNRWILTGTPTPYTPNSQVAHLQSMLKFLHEEVYGQNQDSWEVGILRPFEAKMEEGRIRLLQLLERTMISARKTDLKNIPPCNKKLTFLDFTEEHARSYNELVVTVRRNILMADWNDPSHVESLLNPKQWKFRSHTVRNLRLSCCVAGHIKMTHAGQDIQETMDILVRQSLDPLSEEYMSIRSSLLDGCSCFRCGDWCRVPVITPCRHLLCLDCVSMDSRKCTFPGCENHYDMQSPEILRRPENPNPKWPVPKDLIELQPSYNQDDWALAWQSTSSSKLSYLLGRLKVLHESNRKINYCIDGVHEYKELKSSQDHIHKARKQGTSAEPKEEICGSLPEKVIIFSQFLEHLIAIEDQAQSLMRFRHDPSCLALLMDGSAALGLDLSFVTHVFLMEPIWDRSVEEQVISRAHRMGATRPIHVETLVMRGTIEEQMVEFLQDADLCRGMLKQESSKINQEGTRPHRTLHDFAERNYLARLSFVRTKVKT